MSDQTYATRVLLRAISDIDAGRYVSSDTVRQQLDDAALTSAEKSGAFKTACTEGYLTGVFLSLPGFDIAHPVHAVVPSTHEAGKGRYVKLYRRTAKAVPEHVCTLDFVAPQGDSWDNGDSKTAPGVASTTTGSLAPTPRYRKEA